MNIFSSQDTKKSHILPALGTMRLIITYILVQRLKRINSYAGIVRIRYEGVLSALHKTARGHPFRPYLSAKL